MHRYKLTLRDHQAAINTSWASHGADIASRWLAMPRSILRARIVYVFRCFFYTGVDHAPTNKWKACLFFLVVLSQRHDRYNDPKKYQNDHDQQCRQKMVILSFFGYYLGELESDSQIVLTCVYLVRFNSGRE